MPKKNYSTLYRNGKQKMQNNENINQRTINVPNDKSWWNFVPEACKKCSKHPSNGGDGICNCILGIQKIN